MSKIYMILIFFAGVLNSSIAEQQDGKLLFEDKFDTKQIKQDWIIESGKWEIKNGFLFNRDGGIISLNKDFHSFILEADIINGWTWNSIAFSYDDLVQCKL